MSKTKAEYDESKQETIASARASRKKWITNFEKNYVVAKCVNGCEKEKDRYWLSLAMLHRTTGEFSCIWCKTKQLHGDNAPTVTPARMLTAREVTALGKG